MLCQGVGVKSWRVQQWWDYSNHTQKSHEIKYNIEKKEARSLA